MIEPRNFVAPPEEKKGFFQDMGWKKKAVLGGLATAVGTAGVVGGLNESGKIFKFNTISLKRFEFCTMIV